MAVRTRLSERRAVGQILVLAGAAVVAGCSDGDRRPGRERIVIGEQVFHLERAVDEPARTQGLMHRQSIAEDEGMLFVFPEPEVLSFWMGHCLIDIDIVFLDPHGRVTATHRMKAEPPRRDDESEAEYDARMPRYGSRHRAQFALELRAGTLDQLELRVEDRIPLDLERLKRLAR